MKKLFGLGIISFLLSGWLYLPLLAESVSLQNSSFEDFTGDLPEGWKSVSYISMAGSYPIRSEIENVHSGARSIVIINTVDNDTRLIQDVILKAASVYKFSCWAKVSNVSKNGIGANISIYQQGYSSADLKGTTDTWQELNLYLITGAEKIQTTITIGLGGYGRVSSGTAYFDDVSIEVVDSLPSGVSKVDFRQNPGGDTVLTPGLTTTTEMKPAIQENKKSYDRGTIKWMKPARSLIILGILTGCSLLLGSLYYLFVKYRKKNRESYPDPML